MNIRPISDLRNKFSEVAKSVMETGEPVYLTKNGYGSMVLMSLEQYEALTDISQEALELAMDEADRAAEETDVRYTLDEVIDEVRGYIYEKKAV